VRAAASLQRDRSLTAQEEARKAETLRLEKEAADLKAKEAQLLKDKAEKEAQLAAAKAKLDAVGFPTRVVSVPCVDLFEKQGKAYKEKQKNGQALAIIWSQF
jgi:transketolase